MSALYGAAGVVHDLELTRVLLEAGANPDDGESVYHSTEAAEPGVPAGAARARRDASSRSCSPTRSTTSASSTCGCCSTPAPTPTRAAAVRGPPRPRPGVPAAAGRARRRPRAPRRRGLAPPDAAAHRLPARGAARRATTRRRCSRSSARTPTVDADDLAIAAIARGERPDVVPETLDYDQQEVVILAALRGRMRARRRALRAEPPRRRRRLAGGRAARARRLGRRRRARARSCSPRAPSRPTASTGPCTAREPRARGRDYVGVAEQLVDGGRGHRAGASGAGRRPARRVARSTTPTVSPNAT